MVFSVTKRCLFILITVISWLSVGFSQEKDYKIRTIAFYNVENLFDTINDPLKFDDDRTPEGKDQWTSKKYRDKVNKIAKVISRIGVETTNSAPDIIGVCEVENEAVLMDVINDPQLEKHNYGIIHFDSPDARGIDVALLYKKNAFVPESFQNHFLPLFDEDGNRIYTRDQLLVSGRLDGEEIHFIVNHWPSRSGGEVKSQSKRLSAATLNKKIIDSLQNLNPLAKIISMGDLNDDPTNKSLKKILKTEANKSNATGLALYNPMEKMVKKGLGTLAHRDNWNLFDQIFFTAELLSQDKSSYTFWKAGIYNKPFLVTDSGPYKGYPFRSYSNGNYTGGYSDHFPVYVYLIREIRKGE